MMQFDVFKIHSLAGYIETIYFAEYPDKILMLDGAARPDVERIENFITQKLNRPMSDLKLIISTHMHPDHAGAATFLRTKYGVPIAAFHEADLWYSNLGGKIQQKLDIFLAYYVVRKHHEPKRTFSYPTKIKPDFLLFDQDKIPFFEDWQAIHAPGHTSHMIVIYHKTQKILYAGDVVLKIKEKCQLPFPVELKEYCKQTLLKLSELDVETLLFAHGDTCLDMDSKKIFRDLIPKLNTKLKFPMNLLKIFTANNFKALRQYKKQEMKGL